MRKWYDKITTFMPYVLASCVILGITAFGVGVCILAIKWLLVLIGVM